MLYITQFIGLKYDHALVGSLLEIVVLSHILIVTLNLKMRKVPILPYLLGSSIVLVIFLLVFALFAWVLLINSLAFTATNDRVYQKVFWQIGLVVLFFGCVSFYELPFANKNSEEFGKVEE